MKDLDLSEINEFELELEIHGDVAAGNPPLMLFTLFLEKMRISFEATKIDNGIYKVVLPVLKPLVATGEYKFQVEVMLDGKHFIAVEDKVKFKELKPIVKIKDKTEKQSTIKVEKPKVEVKVSEKQKENKETEKEVKEAEQVEEKVQESIFPQIKHLGTITA